MSVAKEGADGQELGALLRTLGKEQLDFVTVRAQCRTDQEACDKCDVGRSTLTRWKKEYPIDEVIQLMALDGFSVAYEKLRRATSEAVDVLLDDVRHARRHSQIRQNAAKDVLDRTGLKGADKVQLTGADGRDLVINILCDDVNDRPEKA